MSELSAQARQAIAALRQDTASDAEVERVRQRLLALGIGAAAGGAASLATSGAAASAATATSSLTPAAPMASLGSAASGVGGAASSGAATATAGALGKSVASVSAAWTAKLTALPLAIKAGAALVAITGASAVVVETRTPETPWERAAPSAEHAPALRVKSHVAMPATASEPAQPSVSSFSDDVPSSSPPLAPKGPAHESEVVEMPQRQSETPAQAGRTESSAPRARVRKRVGAPLPASSASMEPAARSEESGLGPSLPAVGAIGTTARTDANQQSAADTRQAETANAGAPRTSPPGQAKIANASAPRTSALGQESALLAAALRALRAREVGRARALLDEHEYRFGAHARLARERERMREELRQSLP